MSSNDQFPPIFHNGSWFATLSSGTPGRFEDRALLKDDLQSLHSLCGVNTLPNDIHNRASRQGQRQRGSKAAHVALGLQAPMIQLICR